MSGKRRTLFLPILLICLTILSACGGSATATSQSGATTTKASTSAAASSTNSPASGAGATATTGSASASSATTSSAASSSKPAASPAASPSASTGINAGAANAANNYGFKPGAGSPVDNVAINAPVEITFWHTQTGVNADALNKIIAQFQEKYPNIKVKAEYQGTYTDVYKKTTAAINGGGLPDLSVAYESFVSEYQSANVVLPLEDYINSTKYGLSAQDLQDFYPVYITDNQYAEYNGQMLSFPFTKSVLVMYYNADKLKEAGLQVPQTWSDFVSACKKFTGDVKGYAINIDASTFNGAVYSNGGELISKDQKQWQFNQQPGVTYLKDIEDMVKSGCAYQIAKANDDQNSFADGKVVFTMGSSAGLSYYKSAVDKSAKFNWNVAIIPHGQGAQPITTSYGGNVTLFKSNSPEKELASWLFVKYFTSTDVTAQWSVATGYLPVRKTAADSDVVKAQFDKLPAYKVAVTEIQQYGRPETSVRGTQDTRTFIQDAMTQAIADPSQDAKKLLDDAAAKGNQALQGK
ncbi:MAG: ABC transporter substrate-binding protein [Thermomicrobiales bacterium]|nr:ABC transporter substrate-binding protein [Thermomicrobiales bacterium]